MNSATIFSGGEGVGIGMRAAGIEHLWGIEWANDIAQVARDNGFHSITADVREVDIKKLERPDILHASPVCVNASVAKTDRGEAPEDVETAYATCRFIEGLRPSIFTLENVFGYRNFVAFRVILKCLVWKGYQVDYWHLNAANYGVAQTRKRLILVARLDGRPRRPEPTHAKNPGTMFGLPKWVGWYEAIEDLIPILPESKFAPWQLDRLPAFCDKAFVFEPTEMRDEGQQVVGDNPIYTIKAMRHVGARAFIVNTNMSGDGGNGMRLRGEIEPSFSTKPADDGRLRGFIVDGQNGGMPDEDGERSLTIRDDDRPIFTVSATQTRRSLRAFVADGFNAGREDDGQR